MYVKHIYVNVLLLELVTIITLVLFNDERNSCDFSWCSFLGMSYQLN